MKPPSAKNIRQAIKIALHENARHQWPRHKWEAVALYINGNIQKPIWLRKEQS